MVRDVVFNIEKTDLFPRCPLQIHPKTVAPVQPKERVSTFLKMKKTYPNTFHSNSEQHIVSKLTNSFYTIKN